MTHSATGPQHHLPPVFLEIPESADAGGVIMGTFLNGGLSAADGALLTVPAPVRPTASVVRARVYKYMVLASILLAITAGGLLAASRDIPRPSPGEGNWAELGVVFAFALSSVLGVIPNLWGRKYRKQAKAWVARIGQTWHLRSMLVNVTELPEAGHRSEVIELGDALVRARAAVLNRAGEVRVSADHARKLGQTLEILARYALSAAPNDQRLAREAVEAFVAQAGNYVPGAPQTPH